MITSDTIITHPFSHDITLNGWCVAQIEGTLTIGRNPIDPDTWVITSVAVDGAQRQGHGWKHGQTDLCGPEHKPLFLAICEDYDSDRSPYRHEIDAKWAEAEAERIDAARTPLLMAA